MTIAASDIDIYDPAVGDDPYPTYRILRDHFPVFRDEKMVGNLYAHNQMGKGPRFLITRHADIGAILKDPQRFSSQRWGTIPDDQPQPTRETYRGNLVGDDAPRHTMLRGILQKTLTRPVVMSLDPPIRAQVRALLEAIPASGEVDLAKAVAVPLPIWVIARLLGVPEGDMERFRKWAFSGHPRHWHMWWEENVGPVNAVTAEELEKQRVTALGEFYAYFDERVGARMAEPQDDLISVLVNGQKEVGDKAFTRQELLQLLHLLLLGGNETTTNLISIFMKRAAEDPALCQALRADRKLMDKAIEELIRWEGPVQSVGRRVAEDVELHGVKIPAQSSLVLLIGAANRDDRVFPNPDTYDLTRSPNPHLGFGTGVHFCLGAPVARLEMGIVLNELLDRYSSVEPAGTARLAGTAPQGILSESRRLRGYGHLPLRFKA